jgi:hypothetical protein
MLQFRFTGFDFHKQLLSSIDYGDNVFQIMAGKVVGIAPILEGFKLSGQKVWRRDKEDGYQP